MKYDKLIKDLRICANPLYFQNCDSCEKCSHSNERSDCYNGLKRSAADAIEELQKALEAVNNAHNEGFDVGYWAGRRDYERKWIPVTERLPKGADKSGELCENVWLFFDDGNVYPGWMNGITEKVYYLDNYSGSLMTAPKSRVKMWQPMPEPPKEETDG